MTMEIETVKVWVLPDGRMDSPNTARYLGVTAKTLAMWQYQGKGPHYIRRGRIFYRKADVDDWLCAGQVRTVN
jgi:Helix-turn-helix domain